MHKILGVCAAMVLAASATAAVDDATPAAHDAPKSEPWEIELHPSIWYVGIAGRLELPRDSGDNRATKLSELNLTSSRIAPMGEASLTKGNWLIEARGFSVGAEADSTQTRAGNIGDVTFAPGQVVHASIDISSFELMGGYRVAFDERGVREGGGVKLRTDVRVLAGARLLDIDSTALRAGLVEDSAHETVLEPIIGVRLKEDFYEDFTIQLEVSGGAMPGSPESHSFDIVVGGQWRPTTHVGVQIGYRALFFGVSSGDDPARYEWKNATLEGLFAGITIKF
jgi:hypothetical protein